MSGMVDGPVVATEANRVGPGAVATFHVGYDAV